VIFFIKVMVIMLALDVVGKGCRLATAGEWHGVILLDMLINIGLLVWAVRVLP
jgi:hypothetical protein